MSSAFFSNEEISLNKQVECPGEQISYTNSDDIDSIYELDRCIEWIKRNSYKNVCLQFPDRLLPDSSTVAERLQSSLGQRVYIMADTAYGSCCIDYLTAAHVNADAIIHFGPVCFSPETGKIPCLRIYEKAKLNLDDFEEDFVKFYRNKGSDGEETWVLLDTPYIIYKDKIQEKLISFSNVSVKCIDDYSLNLGSCQTVFVSNEARKILVLSQEFENDKLYYYNQECTESVGIVNYERDVRIAKRRYFLIEKIKDSKTVGIVIGTLAVKNYLKVIERVKKLVKLHNKKYYTISVGRPTVAKLANFPEIDVYILVSCAMNELYESRDFYKPFVTPYDVELALNPHPKFSKFSFDFNLYLSKLPLDNNCDLENSKEDIKTNDVSLISGTVRSIALTDEEEEASDQTKAVSLRCEGTVALSSHYGAGYLSERSWKGLEQNLSRDEPKMAQEGRKGLAMGYENEKELEVEEAK